MIAQKHLNLSSLTLADLCKLNARIQADANLSTTELKLRDRPLSAAINGQSAVHQILYWLRHQHDDHASQAWINTISFWLCVAGFVTGILSVSGLMGASEPPYNALYFILSLTGFQALLFLVTLSFMLKSYFAKTNDTHSLWFQLNPAKYLFHLASKHFPAATSWQNLSTVIYWALLRWGQLFAIAFNLGLITTFILALMFSDRSFTWSSTFNLGSDTLYETTQIVARPWSWFWAAAAPDRASIEASRQVVMQAHYSAEQTAAMRSWWSFILANIVFYGLLPRILLALFIEVKLRFILRSALLAYPGVRQILLRLNSFAIQTHTKRAETEKNQADAPNPARPNIPEWANNTRIPCVDWAKALANYSPAGDVSLCKSTHYSAGLDLDEDRDTLEDLRAQAPQEIVIAVKAWEPPMEELRDFVSALIKTKSIYLVLIPLSGSPISENMQRGWIQFLKLLEQEQTPIHYTLFLAPASKPGSPA